MDIKDTAGQILITVTPQVLRKNVLIILGASAIEVKSHDAIRIAAALESAAALSK